MNSRSAFIRILTSPLWRPSDNPTVDVHSKRHRTFIIRRYIFFLLQSIMVENSTVYVYSNCTHIARTFTLDIIPYTSKYPLIHTKCFPSSWHVMSIFPLVVQQVQKDDHIGNDRVYSIKYYPVILSYPYWREESERHGQLSTGTNSRVTSLWIMNLESCHQMVDRHRSQMANLLKFIDYSRLNCQVLNIIYRLLFFSVIIYSFLICVYV